jgi:methionyl aminopeptidase
MSIAAPPKSNDLCPCGSGRKYKRCHKPLEGRVSPGEISPMLPVPAHIVRPPYAETGEVNRSRESAVKSPALIERMRHVGQLTADVLELAGRAVKPGVTTDEIDIYVHDLCIERNSYPSPLNYSGYPKSVCTSVNEIICHGIPDSRKLEDGDIVNLDVTLYLGGVHGDSNATFGVGQIDEASQALIDITLECLWKGIGQVKPGSPINEIGRAIENHAKPLRYGVVRSFVGHGIGELFHSDLQIPHYHDPRATTIMRPGMTFTIEPMITLGNPRHVIWDDGWTAATADGRRTAQFEHTILVTDAGYEVLTLGTPGEVNGPIDAFEAVRSR